MSDSSTPQGPQENPLFEDARRLMVERHLMARGIRDARVLDAFRKIPRQAFVLPSFESVAYEDHPLEIGWGQTISQPYIVAYMIEQLGVQPWHRVLDVGTGSGYGAAALSLLAREVVSIERNEPLAHTAAFRLKSLGFSNVTVVIGDGTLGYSPCAPYDAVLVSAAAPQVSETLKGQLAVGGRLLAPVGTSEYQVLTRVVRMSDGYNIEQGMRCVFVPLVGEEGWPSA